jgi:hypothetical protein
MRRLRAKWKGSGKYRKVAAIGADSGKALQVRARDGDVAFGECGQRVGMRMAVAVAKPV